MKYYFPVVYALIPFYENKSWVNSDDYSSNVMYYMICKCYLYEEKNIYRVDGSKLTRYKVSLPFVNVYSGNNYFKRIYNPLTECGDFIEVDYVSTSYKKIAKEKEEKESELMFSLHKKCYKKMYGEKIYLDIISRYKEIEKLFEENLEDLPLSKSVGGRIINSEYESDDTYYVYINDKKVRKRISSSEQKKGVYDKKIYI